MAFRQRGVISGNLCVCQPPGSAACPQARPRVAPTAFTAAVILTDREGLGSCLSESSCHPPMGPHRPCSEPQEQTWAVTPAPEELVVPGAPYIPPRLGPQTPETGRGVLHALPQLMLAVTCSLFPLSTWPGVSVHSVLSLDRPHPQPHPPPCGPGVLKAFGKTQAPGGRLLHTPSACPLHPCLLLICPTWGSRFPGPRPHLLPGAPSGPGTQQGAVRASQY